MKITELLLWGSTLVLLVGCSSRSSLIGRWVSTSSPTEYLTFSPDKSFDIESEGKSLQASLAEGQEGFVGIQFEAIDEVEPHQLYIVFLPVGGVPKKAPFGIYKIENGKLIVRQSTEYHRTLGGFDMGVSRIEMPTDFSGILETYTRVQ